MAELDKHRAVFLDRDGTINFDYGYINEPGEIGLLPGVGAALKRLTDAGFLLIVVTNQSGIARGIIQPSQLPKIHARLEELLADEGVRISGYEICTHHPNDGCTCRKPNPELLRRGAERFQVDLTRSFMIGDRDTDIGAGLQAGVQGAVQVLTGIGREADVQSQKFQPTHLARSLGEAADWILAQP